MSKSSRRPNCEVIKEQFKERKRLFKKLREQQEDEGIEPLRLSSMPNRKSPFKTGGEERMARNMAVTDSMRIMLAKLPVLLKRLGNIPDPRNPKKLKHKLTILIIYGILTFVLQMASRREANREMTHPVFMDNLKLFFPELEDLPHSDTLMRLLAKIDVHEIENAQIDLVNKLIRNKKFNRYLINNYYPVAFDGSQKFARDWLWSEECLERNVRVKEGKDSKKQYYVYILEASLAFENGMTIPLMSEFLSYTEGDTGTNKQDCEQKAFKRLAGRLKSAFPKLRIMALLDGLYPNGPIMELLRKKKWGFMIVLQDKSLRSVWEEYEGLGRLSPKNRFHHTWGGRRQHFRWVNGIEYYFGPKENKKEIVHVVVCNESWKDLNKDSNKTVSKSSRHAWISSEPINRRNIHERCNLGARHRWGIESGFLVEKRHGYQYEHCFSYNWAAMKGYHYLMRLGHTFNILTQYSEALCKTIRDLGARGFIHFMRQTLAGPWFDLSWVAQRLNAPFQLRLL
jgi:hypothetical protein